MADSQTSPTPRITESRIIMETNTYTFNRMLAHALMNGWSQNGCPFAVGDQVAVNVVMFDTTNPGTTAEPIGR